jgi:undecaprenyl-diphosphatase
MDMLQAALLGLVQGLTEFLPVSSSGHLVLLQRLFGWTEPELFFDVSVHFGTLLAVCAVFAGDLRQMASAAMVFPSRVRQFGGLRPALRLDADLRMMGLIIAGSVPTAFIGLMFHRVADRIFGSVGIVGVTLILTGILLWLTRYAGRSDRTIGQFRFVDALVIGTVQGMAILPGISRSGSTIAAALFLGIDRELAGRFSFLLSLPAICGAMLLSLRDAATASKVPLSLVLMGTVVAGAVGYVALRVLMHIVKKGILYRFAPYCWALGAIALYWSFG